MNKLFIGARVRITHLKCVGSEKAMVIDRCISGSWATDTGYFIDKDGKTIAGVNNNGRYLIATIELLNPVKRYKFKYKRK